MRVRLSNEVMCDKLNKRVKELEEVIREIELFREVELGEYDPNDAILSYCSKVF